MLYLFLFLHIFYCFSYEIVDEVKTRELFAQLQSFDGDTSYKFDSTTIIKPPPPLPSVLPFSNFDDMTLNVEHNKLNERMLISSPSSCDVSSEFDFNRSLVSKCSIISLTTNIIINTSLIIEYNVLINGNNFTISGNERGMNDSCFKIFQASYVDITFLTVTKCGKYNNQPLSGSNDYSIYGGAFMVSIASYLNLYNCSLISNVAKFGGGIFAGKLSIITLINCEILDNLSIGGLGGGIMILQSYLNMYNCQIISNKVKPFNTIQNSLLFSGGILCYACLSIIYDCNFIKNENLVGTGGGYVTLYGYGEFIRCLFEENKAFVRGGGGAVSMQQDSTLSFLLCNISSNYAYAGRHTIYF